MYVFTIPQVFYSTNESLVRDPVEEAGGLEVLGLEQLWGTNASLPEPRPAGRLEGVSLDMEAFAQLPGQLYWRLQVTGDEGIQGNGHCWAANY
jgi:hypothetical protein